MMIQKVAGEWYWERAFPTPPPEAWPINIVMTVNVTPGVRRGFIEGDLAYIIDADSKEKIAVVKVVKRIGPDHYLFDIVPD